MTTPASQRLASAGADTVVTGLSPSGKPAIPAAPPAIPDVIIASEIGRGGMGVVYRGRQAYIDREVAVKLLIGDGSSAGNQLVRRFQREATILAQLNHPHIVACYSAGTLPDASCYLVMEFIDGPNLAQHITKHGPLSEAHALRVVRDIAAALGYAQGRGIIHRDVKSENILLQPTPAGGDFPWTAKLVDLGLARPVHVPADLNLTQQGMLVGTPATMAPEQFENPDGIDFRVDIYGLGCVLFQVLAGRPAFSGNSLATIVTQKVGGPAPDVGTVRGGVSSGLADLVADLLARSPDDRPASYPALIARCDLLLNGGGKAPRRWWPAVLIGGGVATTVIAVVALRSMPNPTVAVPPVPTVAAPAAPPLVVAAPVAPTPVVVAVVAPPPPEAALGAARALVGDDLRTALAEWVTVPGWGLAEDSNAVIGHSTDTSRITHPLPAAPWVIAGDMRPAQTGANAFREAGIRIEMADGSALQVSVKNLSASGFVALSEIGADGVAKPPRQLLPLPATASWPLRIACQRGQLLVEVGGVTLNPVPVLQATTAMGLTVTRGAVAFAGLTLATP